MVTSRLLLLYVCVYACGSFVAADPAFAGERVATFRIPDVLGAPLREAMGTVIPEREQFLAFEVDGRVDSPQREMGSRVAAGEVILTLDDRVAQASVALAEAGVARAEANLMLQQAQYERLAANHATQAISDADLDTALAALERARAERTRALAERDIAALNLEKHRLVALFDALLDTRTPPPGSYVKTGMPVGTLTDPARRVRLEISSNELRKLQDGRLRVHLRDVRLRDGGALVLISASPTADASSGMHLAHLRMPENVIGSAGELVALQLVDPNAFAHLDRVLRKDEKGAHVLIVIDGVTQRVAWPPTNVNSLAGKPVVVMGGNKLADGSAVDIVALDELRR